MSEEKKKYQPGSDLIDSLSAPVLERVAAEQVPSVPPTPANVPAALVIDVDENRELAVEAMKEALGTFRELLKDLRKLAPASQQGFLYQTAAQVGKQMVDTANLLYNLGDDNKSKENRGGPRSQHLHFHGTSVEHAQRAAARLKAKAEQNGKE